VFEKHQTYKFGLQKYTSTCCKSKILKK